MSSGGGGGGGDEEEDEWNPFAKKNKFTQTIQNVGNSLGNFFGDAADAAQNTDIKSAFGGANTFFAQMFADQYGESLGLDGFNIFDTAMQPFDEGLGEITGRNLARGQNRLMEARIIQEMQMREKMKADALKTQEMMDRAASSAADRTPAKARGTVSTGMSAYQTPDGVERDFLGL